MYGFFGLRWIIGRSYLQAEEVATSFGSLTIGLNMNRQDDDFWAVWDYMNRNMTVFIWAYRDWQGTGYEIYGVISILLTQYRVGQYQSICSIVNYNHYSN